MEHYWIWNYGDYEIYHANLLLSRRQEYGADYPPFWRLSDVERNVYFQKSFSCERDGYLKLHVTGIGYIKVDGNRYGAQERVPIRAGDHRLAVRVMNLNGLPSAYVESDVCPSDNTWYTSEPNGERIPVGFLPCYDSPEKDPLTFPFAYRMIEPIKTEMCENGMLFDFGRDVFGYLHLDRLEEDREYYISYGESREEALDVGRAILFERVSGSSRYRLRQRAFRYIYIPDTADATAVCEFEYLPLEYKGSFRCDKDEVNQIWDTAAYTLHLNCREAILDGIKRDRWIWGGDAYQGYKFCNYLFFDRDIVRRTTLALIGKEPFTQHINTILDYSMYWIIGLYDYYETFGDEAFLRFLYPKAVALMRLIASRENEDGFLEGKAGDWIFVDWADIDRDGAVCAEQMLYIQANEIMVRLARVLDKPCDEYAARGLALREKLSRFYWDEEKGGFIDSYTSGKRHITRHANIFAVLYDIATKEQQARILEDVLKNDAVPPITTPYFKGFELDAMGKCGQLAYIEENLHSYWSAMLDAGATTIWEEYDPSKSGAEHYGMYGDPYGKSLCHAWGATPLYLLGRYYLGVYPTSRGYDTFEVRPARGGFGALEGTVPIGGGEVRVRFADGQLSVVATRAGGTLIWNDTRYPLKPNEEITLAI